eukprot:gene6978-11144_t
MGDYPTLIFIVNKNSYTYAIAINSLKDSFETLDDELIYRKVLSDYYISYGPEKVYSDVRVFSSVDELLKTCENENLGKLNYETYCATVGGYSVNGEKLKEFNELPENIQEAWIKSAQKVLEFN